MTDLGSPGNLDVAKRYQAYLQNSNSEFSNKKCNKRVIITGFGLFTGVDYNISGIAVEAMSQEKYWPSTIDESIYQDELKKRLKRSLLDSQLGVLKTPDNGSRKSHRTLVINGEAYDVCFLVLDVIWDLAGAIINEEAKRFKPDLIIMTGRGRETAIFEGGSLNRSHTLHGFECNGEALLKNTPIDQSVLIPESNSGVENHIPMNWDGSSLQKSTEDIFTSMGFEVLYADEGRRENTYICNNTAFIVAHGLKGVSLDLAGSELNLEPASIETAKHGFLHLPSKVENTVREVFFFFLVVCLIV